MVIVAIVVVILLCLPLLRITKDLLFGPVNVVSVVLPAKKELKNTNGRTNVLLLGIGGPSHDGPNLSDTILVASVKTVFEETDKKTPPVVLISLPRDIYLDSLEDKINFAYAKGVEKNRETGLTMAKATVSSVTGLPIHYAIVGDFSAFQRIVDLLGGVDINVKNTLDDFKYPLPPDKTKECHGDEEDPCWYEHLHFDTGVNHMNGETALKFVRSRHAEGSEGSDFARSKRQQLLLLALKDKFFASETFLNPAKIEQIYNLLKSHIYTDFDFSQINQVLPLALRYQHIKLESVVIDDKLLVNPPIDERGWILLPKDGNFLEIHNYLKKDILKSEKE